MNFNLIRLERIEKLRKKLLRVENALKNFPYTNKKHILEDVAVYEEIEKEIQIQESYQKLESLGVAIELQNIMNSQLMGDLFPEDKMSIKADNLYKDIQFAGTSDNIFKAT